MAKRKKKSSVGWQIYKPENSEFWYIRYRDPNAPDDAPPSKKYPLKTIDRERAKEFASKIYNEAWGQKNLDEPVSWSVNKLLDWAMTTIWQDCIRPKYLESTIKPLREILGHLSAASLKADGILAFRKKRIDQGASIATAIHPLSYLQAAYEAAITCDKLLINPVRKAKKGFKQLFPTSQRRKIALNQEHQDILLNHLNGTLHKIVAFALRTGMRQGEILRLQRAHIDLQRMAIGTSSQKGKGKVVKFRFVPITKDVYDIIMSLPHYGPYLFSYPDGRPLSSDGVVHMPWRRKIRQLAESYPVFKGFTFHGLRHTFITQGLELGGNSAVLKDIVGHSTTQMTDGYTHISNARLSAEMAIYPRLSALKLDSVHAIRIGDQQKETKTLEVLH